ncbi:MAG: MBL fold metallo-hydrolase [Candidatus Electrothrix aestuarii]|uniref:MBL fold metallo-hydrolase n=1 Tax=Candidatus Electrothrix aestuarii TaxID=3062594 RepID=A0AAU8LWS7_9BACT|nr:MBL fold metallo-hydrolase [Candidatus Electrothrix aestuarii]
MKFCVLGSGSKGNCTLIESGSTRILIDAGFSGKEISRRLALIDRSPEDLSAILITHEHGDHISGVGVMSRRCNLPVYANAGTHQASEARVKQLHQRCEFATGTGFDLNDLHIHPFQISHDTADPVGFLVSDGTHSVAYCTDTGKITTLIRQRLRQCNALILESNYDPEMLQIGPYPMHIKQRVRSNQGHLANKDAAAFLVELCTAGVQHVVLAHLSETNNRPELVANLIRQELAQHQPRFSLDLARQDQPSPVITVGKINKE